MKSVRLFHWRPSEAVVLLDALRDAGYGVIYHERSQAPSMREIRESGTFAIVIDLSRLPSHGRNMGAWLRGSKSARHIPLIFAGGDPVKIAAIRKDLPDAIYASHARLVETLRRVASGKIEAPKDPVVPKPMMTANPQRTTAQKLGIRAGIALRLIDPPGHYERVIGDLPGGVALIDVAVIDDSADDRMDASAITLWFVLDAGDLERGLSERRKLAAKSRLWIIWKKGRGDGLNGNFVREAALKVGLVDYKICSLDPTWSGMLFAVKKAKRA